MVAVDNAQITRKIQHLKQLTKFLGLQPQTIIVEVVIKLVSRELFAFEIVVPIGGHSAQTIPR